MHVAHRATEEVRVLLRMVSVNGVTLEDALDRWIANGERMAALVAEQATLRGDDDTRVSAGDLRHARQRWIRVINSIVNALDVMEMPEDDRRHLLANLNDAVAQTTRARAAEQRRKRVASADEPVNGTDVLSDSPPPVFEDVVEDVVEDILVPVVSAEVEERV